LNPGRNWLLRTERIGRPRKGEEVFAANLHFSFNASGKSCESIQEKGGGGLTIGPESERKRGGRRLCRGGTPALPMIKVSERMPLPDSRKKKTIPGIGGRPPV